MSSVSTTEAARRLHKILKDAETGPVMITRHGKLRGAVVSARTLRVIDYLLKERRMDTRIACLEAQMRRAAAGEFNKAVKLRDAGLLLESMITR